MIVYLLTSPSGKKYVGITSRTLEARWKGHCANARRGSKLALHKAVRRYGEDAFKLDVLESVETWEKACEREKFWIAELGSKAPGGYNLTDGGDGVLGLSWKLSDESRVKQAAARRGRKQSAECVSKRAASLRGQKRSDEARARMVAAQKDRKKPPPFSDEHRAKMSSAHKGKKHTPESREKMSVAAKKRHQQKTSENAE